MREETKNKIWRGLIAWGLAGLISYLYVGFSTILNDVTIGGLVDAIIFGFITPILNFKIYTLAGLLGIIIGILYFIFGWPKD